MLDILFNQRTLSKEELYLNQLLYELVFADVLESFPMETRCKLNDQQASRISPEHFMFVQCMPYVQWIWNVTDLVSSI